MNDGERLVQRVFAEAARACGDDPLAIARYVADRVAGMSPSDRALFNGVAESASSYDSHRDTSSTGKPH